MRGLYTEDEKTQAVKLALEIGATKASKSLNIPKSSVENWLRKHKKGEAVTKTPINMTQYSDTNEALILENERLQIENKKLQETIQILSDATAFFATRQKK